MKRRNKTVCLVGSMLIAAMLLSACSLREVDSPAQSGGIGRAETQKQETETLTPPETIPDETEPSEGTQNETVPALVETQPAETEAPIPAKTEETTKVETHAAETEESQTAETVPTAAVEPASDSDSLKPFGASDYWVDGGRYYFNLPSRPTGGLATLDEMYSFPKTYFDDANVPDGNGWFFGSLNYDYNTGEVTYNWDRWQSTKDVFKKYGGIYRGDETRKCVYLTFDAGYEGGYTASILDTLRDKQAPATFFITGPYIRGEGGNEYVDQQIPLVGRMLNEGHIVGNHTNTHPNMVEKSVDEVVAEMEEVERALKAAYPDAPDMLYFRPPEGACNEWLLRLEAKLGYRTVLWSFGHYDWNVDNQPDPATALENFKTHLHPGCVFLMHVQSATNAQILGDLIDYIRGQGYEILPLCSID